MRMRVLLAIMWLWGASMLSCNALAAAEIVITSPASGVTVSPGQVVQVVVNQRVGLPRAYFDQSFGLLASPVYDTQEVISVDPYIVRIILSKDIPAGEYSLVAFGQRRGGGVVLSEAIRVRVAANVAEKVEFWVKHLELRFPGDSMHPVIEAVDAGGQRMVVPDADITLEIANAAVGVVKNGTVFGVGGGRSQLIARVGDLEATAELHVSVPTKPGDFNGDGVVDVMDVSILKACLGYPSVGANDRRDLNRDGKVDALDLRTLTTLCTRPRCATQ